MIGNRTRSTRALARHQAATTAQNVAANVVRASSDAAVSAEVGQSFTDEIDDIKRRVGDLEDLP